MLFPVTDVIRLYRVMNTHSDEYLIVDCVEPEKIIANSLCKCIITPSLAVPELCLRRSNLTCFLLIFGTQSQKSAKLLSSCFCGFIEAQES